MLQRGEKTWRFGSTAATLLAAYLLVLQGVAGGIAGSARFGGIGLFGSSICSSKSDAPLDRSTPARQTRHSDACCVAHCGGLGGATAATAFWDETPHRVARIQAQPLSNETGVVPPRMALPLGSRAPPFHDIVTAA